MKTLVQWLGDHDLENLSAVTRNAVFSFFYFLHFKILYAYSSASQITQCCTVPGKGLKIIQWISSFIHSFNIIQNHLMNFIIHSFNIEDTNTF